MRRETALLSLALLTTGDHLVGDHNDCPMDMEWARDFDKGKMPGYTVREQGPASLRGLSVGGAVVNAPVCLIDSAAESARFRDGAILVTSTTDPRWVPIMKRAAASVTDSGGANLARGHRQPRVAAAGDHGLWHCRRSPA